MGGLLVAHEQYASATKIAHNIGVDEAVHASVWEIHLD